MSAREVDSLSEAEIERFVEAVAFDDRGLVPGVVVRHGTGEVLMLAYLNAESLRRTLRERRVSYWSRSRGELWRKGDTSGNTQRLMGIALDCDADTLRLEVVQAGPACHTGTATCFDGDPLAVRFTDADGPGDPVGADGADSLGGADGAAGLGGTGSPGSPAGLDGAAGPARQGGPGEVRA